MKEKHQLSMLVGNIKSMSEKNEIDVLTKEQKKELEGLLISITEEAISVRLDYEQNGSELDSGSLVAIHQNSPLLDDEKEKLSDIAYNVVKKEKK